MNFIITINCADCSITTEVEAHNQDAAFEKALRYFKKNSLAKYLPMNPRAYAKIVPKSTLDLPRDNR